MTIERLRNKNEDKTEMQMAQSFTIERLRNENEDKTEMQMTQSFTINVLKTRLRFGINSIVCLRLVFVLIS